MGWTSLRRILVSIIHMFHCLTFPNDIVNRFSWFLSFFLIYTHQKRRKNDTLWDFVAFFGHLLVAPFAQPFVLRCGTFCGHFWTALEMPQNLTKCCVSGAFAARISQKSFESTLKPSFLRLPFVGSTHNFLPSKWDVALLWVRSHSQVPTRPTNCRLYKFTWWWVFLLVNPLLLYIGWALSNSLFHRTLNKVCSCFLNRKMSRTIRIAG